MPGGEHAVKVAHVTHSGFDAAAVMLRLNCKKKWHRGVSRICNNIDATILSEDVTHYPHLEAETVEAVGEKELKTVRP